MLDLKQRFDLVGDILRSSSDCIKVLDLDGALIFMSEGGQRVMEIDDVDRFIGCPWPDFWQDEGNVAAKAAIAEAKAGRHASFRGMARTGKGRERWWDVAVSPVRDEQGAVTQILSISRDVTELEDARQRQRLLMEELNHRVKNNLTVIKALARQTLRDVTERAAVDAFDARLMALSAAHDVLMQEAWSNAAIGAVVGSAVKLHEDGPRFTAAGPDVMLGPQTALNLSLLLHELATNAVKYGALSVPAGRVGIDWRFDGDDDEDLVLQWRETGGPLVATPARSGFGSRLIGIGFGNGNAERSYLPGGLVASFRTPVGHVAA